MERDWTSYKNLGEQAESQQRYDLAEAAWAMAALLAEQYGESSPHLAYSLDRLGFSLIKQKEYTSAQYCLGRSWHIKTKVLGSSDLDKAVTANLFAELYFHQGKYVDSQNLVKWVLERYTALLGVDHPQTVAAAGNYAFFERMNRESEAARPAVNAAPVAPSRPTPTDKYSMKPRCERCGSELEGAEECLRCTGTTFSPISPLDRFTS